MHNIVRWLKAVRSVYGDVGDCTLVVVRGLHKLLLAIVALSALRATITLNRLSCKVH